MNASNEQAISVVRSCLRTVSKSISDFKNGSSQQKSYSRWAVKELLSQLKTHPETPPLIIIEEFRDQMDKYSCLNPHTSYIFSCAKDMAEWIIDLLIS